MCYVMMHGAKKNIIILKVVTATLTREKGSAESLRLRKILYFRCGCACNLLVSTTLIVYF